MDDATISYHPTEGLSYDPAEPRYWEPAALGKELVRTFEVCHGCRLCFKYCDAFPTLFALIDERHGGDVRRITEAETARVLDACFQCKLCEVQCPYTPREGHAFQLDVPRLAHRYRAQHARARGLRLRDRVLARPDLAARLARLSLGLANLANRLPAHRWLLERVLGIHRAKRLPDFAPTTFERWAARTGRIARAPGGEVVLFQTCYVQNNEPEIGRDTVAVLEKNGVDVRCAAGLACCGMPAWERGDLATLRAQARANLRTLLPFVERGAKVVVINPTCSMMMRREHPTLVDPADRPAAERVAAAVADAGEFLWSIRNEPRFSADFRSTPGGPVAYHAPCHLRAQGVGFKGRDLLRRIPGVQPVTVLECSGHDGTYAMTVEGFEPSIRIGARAFEGMKAAGAQVWVTDCPLAALQFEQHAGVRALHPMTVLARAYREDGFPTPVPRPGAPGEEGRRG
ncbi:MAG TPA: heterodisulfide reductase-related iron-sulfur binding cluster [Candidatus Tectomicrobia bacterium]|nr:heterodisulfide reductase-related iron-sulfur binding cluster [Candidatus Tectomicrobia bacterium]